MKTILMKINSGGQSGVDRAALDAARELGIEICGWCPKGGWAEDMPDPPGVRQLYPELKETPSKDVSERTMWNVRDSDALITFNSGVSPGTNLAKQTARNEKPILELSINDRKNRGRIRNFIMLNAREYYFSGNYVKQNHPFILSIGGPRESEYPGIYQKTLKLLLKSLPKGGVIALTRSDECNGYGDDTEEAMRGQRVNDYEEEELS